jgi:hypothetical protein
VAGWHGLAGCRFQGGRVYGAGFMGQGLWGRVMVQGTGCRVQGAVAMHSHKLQVSLGFSQILGVGMPLYPGSWDQCEGE